MAEQIKYGDRLFLAGEKVILDNGETSPKLEARNGELVIGYNKLDTQAKDHHVLIRGDLTVEGTMTSIQTVDTVIKDNIIVLNDGEPGDGVSTIRSGIEIDRGTLDNEIFLFSEEGWLGTGGVDPAIDVVLPSWLSSTLSLTDDLSAENIYARNSATVNGNLDVTGQLRASSNQEHQIGDFTFNQNVMSVVATDMEIRSPGGISFYPDEDNSNPVPQGGEKIVWLRDGAKLVFEGTVPDDFEVKLQATDITDDRDIILPDESGTLALQEWTTREIDKIKNRIGDTPPENPLNGNLWWNSNTGRLKIYYEDVDSSQWVDAVPATGTVTLNGQGGSTFEPTTETTTETTTFSSIYESSIDDGNAKIWDLTFPFGTVIPSSDFDKIIQIRSTAPRQTIPPAFTLEDGTYPGQTIKILVNPIVSEDYNNTCRVYAKTFIGNYIQPDGTGSNYNFIGIRYIIQGYGMYQLFWTGNYWVTL